jgi:hypothetical protein
MPRHLIRLDVAEPEVLSGDLTPIQKLSRAILAHCTPSSARIFQTYRYSKQPKALVWEQSPSQCHL